MAKPFDMPVSTTVEGWTITVLPKGSAHDPDISAVGMKEIACNDTAVSWSSKTNVIAFESEPPVSGGYAMFNVPVAAMAAFLDAIKKVTP